MTEIKTHNLDESRERCEHDFENLRREVLKGQYGAYSVYICPKCGEDCTEDYKYYIQNLR